MDTNNPSTPPPATPLSNANTNTSTTLTIENRSCPLAPVRKTNFCRRKKNKNNIVSLRPFKFDVK